MHNHAVDVQGDTGEGYAYLEAKTILKRGCVFRGRSLRRRICQTEWRVEVSEDVALPVFYRTVLKRAGRRKIG